MPERYDCPPEVAERLKTAGGTNPFGDAIFRVVWGWNRMVKMHGRWGDNGQVETREVPKYDPPDRWYLEMWRPPHEYGGSPEGWRKAGEEVDGFETIDCAGEFPHRGEYEIVYPLTSDLTESGDFVPLNARVAELLVTAVRKGPQWYTPAQRKAAIRQRVQRERKARIETTIESLLDARPAFYDAPTSFRTGPKNHKIETGLWVPPQYR